MKLIKTQDKFILVSDEEIKEGDSIFETDQNNINVVGANYVHNLLDKKALSEKPDFSLLKEKDCKEIGWVDVEKLANDFDSDKNSEARKGFIEGFKTAQSLNHKQFSLEDMELYTQWCSDKGYSYNASFGWEHPNGHRPNNSELIKEYAKSLQKTEWDVEVEMETPYTDGFTEDSVRRFYGKPHPKITNNSIKITKIL